MSEVEFTNEIGIGLVEAAISRFGGKINQGSRVRNRFQKDVPDLQERGTNGWGKVDKTDKNRKVAATVETQAEMELLQAKNVVRELTAQIEVLKSKAEQQTEEIQSIGMIKGGHDQSASRPAQMEDYQPTDVMQEFEVLKRECTKIKQEMARAREEKTRSENDVGAAGLRLRSFVDVAEQLRREIEEANEEEVLVELARIQALKELAAIEAQKKEEETQFLSSVQETNKKIEVLRNEVEQLQQLKEDLAKTKSDVDVLQNELKLVQEMDKKNTSSDFPLFNNSALWSATKDLKAKKKELESIKTESFRLMSSMDAIRNELNNISKEKDQIQKSEAETVNFIEKLNSARLIAKDELEATFASEDEAKSTISNFGLSLRELQKEKEAANKEKKCAVEETACIRDEFQKTESATDSVEDRLWDTMEELEAVKKAEVYALLKLKTVVENAAISRDSKNTTTITVSKFEYDYLTGCANSAVELASKKTAAAHAWAEALRANGKEMQIKTVLAERQAKGLKQKEDQELRKLDSLLNEKKNAELEIQKQRKQENKPIRERRSITEKSFNSNPTRHTNFRQSIGSPATRRPIVPTTFSVKRKRKAMYKLRKHLTSSQIENNKSVPLVERQ